MCATSEGAPRLDLNSGTGATGDRLNLAGGAGEDLAMTDSANCSNLLSCASRQSCTFQWAKRSPFSSLFASGQQDDFPPPCVGIW